MRFAVLGLLAASLVPGVGARAETKLDDIISAVNAGQSELDKVDALLADPNRNKRIAAMTLLLKSSNPSFVARAKEIGLTSADTEMQAAALGAIFDSGGPFKMIFDLSKSDDEKNRVKSWLGGDGIWDEGGQRALYVFKTKPYDPKKKCWTPTNDDSCVFTIVGRTIAFGPWSSGVGSFELSGEGKLVGTFRYTNGNNVPVAVEIPLME